MCEAAQETSVLGMCERGEPKLVPETRGEDLHLVDSELQRPLRLVMGGEGRV